MHIKIAPSLLAADWLRLGEEIDSVQKGGADLLHCDVMDGHFVPNLTIGPHIVRAIASVATVPLDVHLMLDNPAEHVGAFAQAGAATIGFHIEVAPDPRPTIEHIRRRGRRVSLTLNPGTPATAVLDYLEAVDQVLVMSVHPGFGGQAFIPEVLETVRALRRAGPPSLDVEIDGGINPQTARSALEAGANVLVAGTSVFGAADRGRAIEALRGAAVGV
ncbi:MAG: ribulose-phosphate 3-epimerase [bacterium]